MNLQFYPFYKGDFCTLVQDNRNFFSKILRLISESNSNSVFHAHTCPPCMDSLSLLSEDGVWSLFTYLSCVLCFIFVDEIHQKKPTDTKRLIRNGWNGNVSIHRYFWMGYKLTLHTVGRPKKWNKWHSKQQQQQQKHAMGTKNLNFFKSIFSEELKCVHRSCYSSWELLSATLGAISHLQGYPYLFTQGPGIAVPT